MTFSSKKIDLGVGLLFISVWVSLLAMPRNDGYYDPRGHNGGQWWSRNSREQDASVTLNNIREIRKNKEKKLEALGIDKGEERKKLEEEIQKLKEDELVANKHLQLIIEPTLAKLIASSMVDQRHSEYMGDVDGFWNAVGRGVTVNIADQAGVVLRKRIAGILDKILGGSLDFCTGKLQGFFEDLYTLIFYSGNLPFTPEALDEWQKSISSLLVDIERTIEKGLATSLRGHDMSLRGPKVDDDLGDGQEPKIEESLPRHDVLQELVSCYIEQFSRLIIEIEMRKQAYADNTLIVFYATQIQRHLDSLAKTLSRADSLTALDAAFNSNKSIIVAIRNNINSLFTSLKIQIAPRSYSIGKDYGTTSSPYDYNRSAGRMARGGYDDEQVYPSPFGAAHGAY